LKIIQVMVASKAISQSRLSTNLQLDMSKHNAQC